MRSSLLVKNILCMLLLSGLFGCANHKEIADRAKKLKVVYEEPSGCTYLTSVGFYSSCYVDRYNKASEEDAKESVLQGIKYSAADEAPTADVLYIATSRWHYCDAPFPLQFVNNRWYMKGYVYRCNKGAFE